ncbi:MAG: amidohydrolase family protein, partial [Bacteroidales bacterium]|nr:amidohydrolase family protein [Bacteroidales bacterium]
MIIKNIGELVGIVPRGVLRKQGQEMSETGILHDAWLRIAPDGIIEDFGTMREAGADSAPAGKEEVIDAEGGMVMPGFCDSHTHIVYAGSR